MGRNTSISLGTNLDSFIDQSINDGRFNNASEVARAGQSLLEKEENKIIVFRKAIIEGLESGKAYDFDAKRYLTVLKYRIKANG